MRSYDTSTPLQTAALPDEATAKVVYSAIIRGANAHGLGVKIRQEQTENGTYVITFQAQDKTVRAAKA
jgi:hypothetical protein